MDGSWGVRDRQEWDRQCSCATTSNCAPLQSRHVQFRSCVLWDADLGTAIWRWEDGWPVQTHNRWSFAARASWRMPKSRLPWYKGVGNTILAKGRTCPKSAENSDTSKVFSSKVEHSLSWEPIMLPSCQPGHAKHANLVGVSMFKESVRSWDNN